MADELAPILTELTPIPGTHLHRRHQGNRELAPVYTGKAQNEFPALAEALSVGLSCVSFAGSLYYYSKSEWFLWSL